MICEFGMDILTPDSAQDSQKSTKSNPLMEIIVECPVCGKEGRQLVLKNHLFTERDLDIDLRPKELIWLAKDVTKIVPRLYYIWVCMNCSYAAGHPFFKNPTDRLSMALSKYRERFKAVCLDTPSVQNIIRILIADIKPDNPDYFQAVKLHLLAIFQNSCMVEVVRKDAMNLGRYCLRLGWLYRDIEENQNIASFFNDKHAALMATLKKGWPGIPENEQLALKLALKYYHGTHERSHSIKSVLDEVMLMLLMVRIYLRLGYLQQGRKLLLKCKEKAVKFDTDRKQARTSENDANYTKLAAESRRMHMSIDEVQNIVDDFLQKKEEQQMATAKMIVKKMSGKKPSEIRAFLLEKKFPDKIVDALIPKKKGFLGMFK